jgi:hypothetical protein
MEKQMWTSENYSIKCLMKLVGYKVAQVLQAPDSETGEPYLGLLLKNGADERAIWFLRDEEGNGAGFFDIEPLFLDEEL